jgi:hypothetical protein
VTGVEGPGAGSDGVFSAGETLSVTWVNNSNNETLAGVQLDFTAIGGGYVYAKDLTNTQHWIGEYTIPTGHPDMDNAYVRVTATDDAGNSGYAKSTPFILHETINSVPEPSTLFLLVSGLVGLVRLKKKVDSLSKFSD